MNSFWTFLTSFLGFFGFHTPFVGPNEIRVVNTRLPNLWSCTLTFNGETYPCALGRNGVSSQKKEGDGCSPMGSFKFRRSFFRKDRIAEPNVDSSLKLRATTQNDGWCDDSNVTQYNQYVTLPFAYSHEKLWLDTHEYDLLSVIGYNDDPIVPLKGSAIFLHVATPGYGSTAGCVSLALEDLIKVLQHVNSKTIITIG